MVHRERLEQDRQGNDERRVCRASHREPQRQDGPLLIIERGDSTVWYAGNTGSDVGVQDEVVQSQRSSRTTVSAATFPVGLAVASDGNVYWAESGKGALGYAFSGGTGETSVGGSPNGIVSGPDGNLWYADSSQSQIVQFSPASKTVINRYLIPSMNADPIGIVVGNDGALWFSETKANKVGRITVSGAITEYPIPSAAGGVQGIAVRLTAPSG